MSPPDRPLPPATPPDAIAAVVRDKVILGEHTFLIDRPGGSDDLLAHPAVRAAFAADGYLPYWADLWPAARMLAKAVLAERWELGAASRAAAEGTARLAGPTLTALEVGCGL